MNVETASKERSARLTANCLTGVIFAAVFAIALLSIVASDRLIFSSGVLDDFEPVATAKSAVERNSMANALASLYGQLADWSEALERESAAAPA